MRAFVLCTGRCGSLTFALACQHIANYTAAHQSRRAAVQGRVEYPDGHVEVDNHLAWFLGPLAQRYGDAPVYVHLTRDPEAVARSWARRYGKRRGLLRGFATGVLWRPYRPDRDDPLELARLMVATQRANIETFLRDKGKVVRVDIADPHDGFDEMWDLLAAEGDLAAAHAALEERHHAGPR